MISNPGGNPQQTAKGKQEAHALMELYVVPYFAVTKRGVRASNLPEIEFIDRKCRKVNRRPDRSQ